MHSLLKTLKSCQHENTEKEIYFAFTSTIMSQERIFDFLPLSKCDMKIYFYFYQFKKY